MALSIRHLTKQFGSQKAINDISLEVKEGEIVGFLGPNGAGKSTTMRILTGYLPPTSGSVQVAGYDTAENPLKVKQSTGYLPEHNPLYGDMYVHEYLRFAGSLHGLRGKKLTERVKKMIQECGLTAEQNKRIEELSKGYRQRVGLAQAMLHDPGVLILDEPTAGLDPNQLVEIRNLIRAVSGTKTILFSTHIMQEVQALCKRVVVIHQGRIVADDLIDNLLKGRSDELSFYVEFDGNIQREDIEGLDGVIQVQQVGATAFRISGHDARQLQQAIFKLAADRGIFPGTLRQEENSLEHVFSELTKPIDGDAEGAL